MAKPEKNVPVSYIIIASLLFFCLSALLVFLIYNHKIQSDPVEWRVAFSVSKLDEGDIKAAWKSLRKSFIKAETSRDWKMIMHQAYLISSESENWNYLRKASSKAVSHYRGREDFWAVYLSSLLWSEQYKKAFRFQQRIQSEALKSISAEIFLVEESLRLDPDIKPYKGVLDLLERKREAEYYEHIARLTDNNPLKADAAILWMGRGEIEKAYNLIRNMADSQVPDQISGYIAYDYGDWKLAQSFLLNQLQIDKQNHIERWTLNSMLADLYYLLSDYEEAEKFYKYSLDIDHSVENWKSVLNLSILYQQMGIEKSSRKWMEEAMDNLIDQPEVIRHFAEFWRKEYPVIAERFLTQYLQEHPDDTSMKLSQMLNFPKEMTPVEYSAFLWDLFNKDTADTLVSRFLVWYLMSLGDYQGALLVIERHHRMNPLENWTPLYESIILALLSPENWEETDEILSSGLPGTSSGFATYNHAVIITKTGNGFRALNTLKEAVDKLEREGYMQDPVIHGKVYSLYGQIYLDLGDTQKALENAYNALKLDETNTQARSLILEIENN